MPSRSLSRSGDAAARAPSASTLANPAATSALGLKGTPVKGEEAEPGAMCRGKARPHPPGRARAREARGLLTSKKIMAANSAVASIGWTSASQPGEPTRRVRHRKDQRQAAPAGRAPSLRPPPAARPPPRRGREFTASLSAPISLLQVLRSADTPATGRPATAGQLGFTLDSPAEVSDDSTKFETQSGIPLAASTDRPISAPTGRTQSQLGEPGQYPFTRGPHASMYRGKLWTMRMFSGFGTPEDTNRRFKFLLAQGQTGLSTAFDMPTLMGSTPTIRAALGEVGREGVSVASVADMERLFADIPLDEVTTSMTINAPAVVLLAFYVVAAERRGIAPERLGGTIQNDMLKEFIAQKEWICGVRPHLRIIRDMLVYCTRADAALEHHQRQRLSHPRGGRDRGAGAGVHAGRRHRLRRARARGGPRRRRLRAAAVVLLGRAQRLLRGGRQAARRAAHVGADHARALRRQEPALVDAAHARADRGRVADGAAAAQQRGAHHVQALAAVLGGTQSLHTNSFDETYALPTEEAAALALRTQQIIAEESGIPAVADPLGGSYFVEALTDRMEAEATRSSKIDEMGGIVRAVEEGYPQREIAASAYRLSARSTEASGPSSASTATRPRRDARPHPEDRSPAGSGAASAHGRAARAARRRGGRAASTACARASRATNDNIMEAVLEAVRSEATSARFVRCSARCSANIAIRPMSEAG